MAMNVGRESDDEVMIEINTTPLIDVMLVLLIMLIITIPLQTHSVKLDLPTDAGAPPVVKPQIVDVNIGSDGSVSWNGVVVADAGALDEYLRGAATANPQPEIHLKPSKRVKYDVVAKVLAAAQRRGVVNMGFVDIGPAADSE